MDRRYILGLQRIAKEIFVADSEVMIIGSTIPWWVLTSMNNEYKIIHKGLLYWIFISIPALTPINRPGITACNVP